MIVCMIEVKKKKNNLQYSIVFLVIIILITGGLYWYNSYVISKNNDLEQEISLLKSQIITAKKDRGVLVSTLLESNKKILQQLENRNDISSFITHMWIMERSYNLKFQGFQYVNWVINTDVSFESKKSDIANNVWIDATLAYKDTVEFIKKYRNNKNAPFILEFINMVNGTDTINFPIALRLK